MGRDGPSEGRCVLICAPFGRDAENVAALLRDDGYDAHVCADLIAVARLIDEHVGAVLLTEEALGNGLQPLIAAVEAQPSWSDLPFLLLAAPRRARAAEAARLRMPAAITNVVVLERPLGRTSLESALQAVVKSRQKQFEMRDRLDELHAGAEALRRSQAELEERVADRTAALQQEMDQRLRAEEALRQSQKMEAVGQLTGGIAHDFNNMLTGVIGAMDIMKRRLATGKIDDLGRFMDAAHSSAQRAAALTARLLAFSRRQSLDARPLDVNALVLSLEDLLQRSLHENITLAIVPGNAVPNAVADTNQLENALLNLVINARDAMPKGGQLTIETSVIELDEAYAAAKPDVKAGRYVVLAVSDTGVGMTPELMERVFEPFFSTKPTGHGTGLGLSMVYGFARQSGGQVRIHSKVGEGTSVKLYLPVADCPAQQDSGPERPAPSVGDGQTVLLVEDDESVRLLVREVLEELRYEAVEAGSADEALPILQSDRMLHLMVSDVGLPGMNGRQLAELARAHRPDLPILFVTGYAENAAVRAGFLGTGMEMITKPFAIEMLSAKIAEMMGPGAAR